jgi:RNA polymerase sigma factor (sigma-70 family)
MDAQQEIKKLKTRIAWLEKRKKHYQNLCYQHRFQIQHPSSQIRIRKNYNGGLDAETVARVWDALADEKSDYEIEKTLGVNILSVRAIRKNKSYYIEMRERALEEMDNLEERERVVLRLRFGFDGDQYTLAGVAEVIGVTKERVRQIELRALNKLRRWMKRGSQ